VKLDKKDTEKFLFLFMQDSTHWMQRWKTLINLLRSGKENTLQGLEISALQVFWQAEIWIGLDGM
jgi:hypothetical protein